jgi:hypothetical protein
VSLILLSQRDLQERLVLLLQIEKLKEAFFIIAGAEFEVGHLEKKVLLPSRHLTSKFCFSN